ncbi:hypothetical protein Tco_0925183 [Tanacetum coccineum]|uniref:Uncharacterized protein n=1 Tax=Tanacetum coccineum TaxID=301880 RepID=A0ABQ5DD39_9ASTR
MAGSEDDIPPTPPPLSPPSQHNLQHYFNIKLPYSQEGRDYEIWGQLKMEHLFGPLLQTIFLSGMLFRGGNGPESPRRCKIRNFSRSLPFWPGLKFLNMRTKAALTASSSSSRMWHSISAKHRVLMMASTVYGVSLTPFLLFPTLDHEDLRTTWIEFDLEEIGLTKCQVAIDFHGGMKSSYKKKGAFCLESAYLRGIKIVGGEMLGTLGIRINKIGGDLVNRRTFKDLVTLDGEGVDWTSHTENKQENYALMACSEFHGSDKSNFCSKEYVPGLLVVLLVFVFFGAQNKLDCQHGNKTCDCGGSGGGGDGLSIGDVGVQGKMVKEEKPVT